MTDAGDRVQALLEEFVATGPEIGLQVAAYLEGELVVDAWAGLADEASGRPVGPDTLFTVFSVSKGVTATCVHLLAERGQIDYEDPVAAHWPEFAANGKEGVTIRHVLTHSAGLPTTPSDLDTDTMIDWERMCAEVAAAGLQWEPGTRSGYHGSTYGWILGEVLRRVDGRRIEDFLQEEICRPLRIDSLFFGVPAAEEHRVAMLATGPLPPPELRTPWFEKAVAQTPDFNRSDVRRAALPAHGGIMNARSLARHYALLERGGNLDGVRILSPERIRIATEVQYEGPDAQVGFPVRRGLGYGLGGVGFGPVCDRPDAFGHGGLGGAEGFVDPGRRIAFALVKDYLDVAPDENSTTAVVYRAVLEALGLA